MSKIKASVRTLPSEGRMREPPPLERGDLDRRAKLPLGSCSLRCCAADTSGCRLDLLKRISPSKSSTESMCQRTSQGSCQGRKGLTTTHSEPAISLLWAKKRPELFDSIGVSFRLFHTAITKGQICIAYTFARLKLCSACR